MTFAYLFTANVYYGPFGKLQKRPPLTLQIITRSIIATYYGKYGELLECLKDKLIFNNNEIVGDVRDKGKVEDVKDVEKAEDGRDKRNTIDARGAENILPKVLYQTLLFLNAIIYIQCLMNNSTTNVGYGSAY